MDYMKDFLETLTKDGRYYAEAVGTTAEIYIQGDEGCAALLELEDDMYHVNFRCDMFSQIVAQITYDMTVIDEDIVIGVDFFSSPNTGIVYGEEALKEYFISIVEAIDAAQMRQEGELSNATFIVQEPIYAYGNKENKQNRMQRLWGTDLE